MRNAEVRTLFGQKRVSWERNLFLEFVLATSYGMINMTEREREMNCCVTEDRHGTPGSHGGGCKVVFRDGVPCAVVDIYRRFGGFTVSLIRVIILMMQTASTCETSVNIYQNTRYSIPEDSHLRAVDVLLYERSGSSGIEFRRHCVGM
jgi:hypothetical protein